MGMKWNEKCLYFNCVTLELKIDISPKPRTQFHAKNIKNKNKKYNIATPINTLSNLGFKILHKFHFLVMPQHVVR